jgi:hypothetical protein
VVSVRTANSAIRSMSASALRSQGWQARSQCYVIYNKRLTHAKNRRTVVSGTLRVRADAASHQENTRLPWSQIEDSVVAFRLKFLDPRRSERELLCRCQANVKTSRELLVRRRFSITFINLVLTKKTGRGTH